MDRFTEAAHEVERQGGKECQRKQPEGDFQSVELLCTLSTLDQSPSKNDQQERHKEKPCGELPPWEMRPAKECPPSATSTNEAPKRVPNRSNVEDRRPILPKGGSDKKESPDDEHRRENCRSTNRPRTSTDPVLLTNQVKDDRRDKPKQQQHHRNCRGCVVNNWKGSCNEEKHSNG